MRDDTVIQFPGQREYEEENELCELKTLSRYIYGLSDIWRESI